MFWLFLGTVSLVNINKLVVSLLNEEEDTGKLETSVNSVPKKIQEVPKIQLEDKSRADNGQLSIPLL